MNPRDELTTLILGKTAPRAADAILAAGYRKPRTVTTDEELDALPEGTVVLSETYRHFVDEWQVSLQRWSDGAWHRGGRAASTHPDNFLPATVIYEGDE